MHETDSSIAIGAFSHGARPVRVFGPGRTKRLRAA
jgi:hypothetical protein